MQTVSIVFSFNNTFSELASGAISSLVRHTSAQYKYDIYIVHDDISDQNKYLITTISKKDNVSIKFIKVDFKKFTNEDINYRHTRFSFTRLFLHRVFNDLGKILYLDSDIIVTSDIAELFNQDLEGCAIGACPDAIALWGIETLKKQSIDTKILLISDQYKSRYDYLRDYMKLTDSEINSHFNAGVLLIDIKKGGGVLDEKLPLLLKKRFWNADQDILNIIFKKDRKILDQRFNMPAGLVLKYISTTYKSPVIIHFIGQKPTTSMTRPMAYSYWEEISKTHLYYSAIERYIEKKTSDFERRIHHHFNDERFINDFYYNLRRLERLITRRKYIRLLIKPLVNRKKYEKLKRDPSRFFADSKSKFIRFIGKLYF